MHFLTRLHLFTKPPSSTFLCTFFQNGGREILTRVGMNMCSLSSAVSAETSDLEHDETHDIVKATEKADALRLAVSQLASEFSKESMLSMQKFFGVRRAHVVPSGSLKLDLALGIGGLPKGRIVEIYGREAAGKTTLALHVIKEAQKLGGYCAYLDAEHALDLSLVEAMGVNTKNLLISHPDCAENLLSMVDTLTKSGAVDVIVVDSVAALVPKLELDELGISTKQDFLSRMMTQALRKIHYSLSHSQTLIIFVNQIRFSPKSGKGCGPMEEVTCGGNALRFYAALRLRLSRIGLIKTEDKVEGLQVSVQVVKNKLAPATMKKAELGIKFGRGFCHEKEVLDLACEHGIIVKYEGSYFIEGQSFNSREAAELYLAKNDRVCVKLVMDLRRLYFLQI
ncbi:PREDICTED: DNA repair protein recA homolog 2, mitochondrial isoform X1 [Lupinus angustifolius]|uniref:DNA repair protein recA homolog 2, mitochondrial isoform X1 n=1 Tax=Lupinus angustifolius TaxID=3871 RepID=UPI00092F9B69|nr:PREDICTED: DNA repair protein recA homolog 2, mitochondrial isoform X1 [Lupinus angustifolius]XP_019456288.1 PREDICTED: DNA repair protein recA homolog 2, mitochondrial isoform X1 [Lupinus angustifolius]